MILTNAARTVFYSAWFCPFAQRVWMALNEREISYELVEALELDPDTQAYIKNEDLLRYNPDGLVPTLVQTDEAGVEHVSKDSIPLLKELFRNVYDDNKLEQWYEEAQLWNKRICSPFYRVLMRQDTMEREKAWNEIVYNLKEFCDHLTYGEDNAITFYDCTQDKPGLIDLCVFPFVHRLYVLQHYKGYRFPPGDDRKKLEDWQEKMESRSSVHSTLAPRDQLLSCYARYADGTAQSKVADAVRGDRNAHDV